jgi:fucose permease
VTAGDRRRARPSGKPFALGLRSSPYSTGASADVTETIVPTGGRAAPAALRRARLGVSLTFFLTGAVFATWATRIPAIKAELGLGDGQLAVAFVGLNAGAIVGLQVGGILVPRTGSRPTLRLALPLFAAALVALALAGSLAGLTVALFVSAAVNSVVDVGMNAHGVEVERRTGRPILSGLHAMHSLGGIAGGALGALAAGLAIGTTAHFVAVALAAGMAALLATDLLLPAAADAAPEARAEPGARGALAGWLRGWSTRIVLVGLLAFCVTLAEGSALDWAAVYLRDTLGADAGVAALGVALFLAGITLGRLAGDGLIARFGPVAAFRAGALTAGLGFGAVLAIGAPAAGLAGLTMLGLGISYLLPLLIGAAGRLGGESAAAVVARVSTLGYLGSFVGPALIGGLAAPFGLALALALPALLVSATALGASAVTSPES